MSEYTCEEVDVKVAEAVDEAVTRLAETVNTVKRERDKARSVANQLAQDLEDAAGELAVPLPEPGTTMAKVIAANLIMRRERDAARSDVGRLTARLIDAKALRSQRDAARRERDGWIAEAYEVKELAAQAKGLHVAIREACERADVLVMRDPVKSLAGITGRLEAALSDVSKLEAERDEANDQMRNSDREVRRLNALLDGRRDADAGLEALAERVGQAFKVLYPDVMAGPLTQATILHECAVELSGLRARCDRLIGIVERLTGEPVDADDLEALTAESREAYLVGQVKRWRRDALYQKKRAQEMHRRAQHAEGILLAVGRKAAEVETLPGADASVRTEASA